MTSSNSALTLAGSPTSHAAVTTLVPPAARRFLGRPSARGVDLHDRAAGSDVPHARRDEVVRERAEDDVDPRSAGRGDELFAEGTALGIERMGRALREDVGPLGGRARG